MRVWMIDAINTTPFYNASLCRALLQEGCDVTMMTSPFHYDEWPIYRDTRVQYRFSRFMMTPGLRKSVENPRFRRLLRGLEYPFDLLRLFIPQEKPRPVLHFQWATAPAIDSWIWMILRHAGYRVVYTAHNVIPHDAKQPPRGLCRVYTAAQRIIVHSPAIARELQSFYPEGVRKLRIIPHGTLLDDVPEVPRNVARTYLGLPSDARVVLFFGVVAPYKGVNCLLQAFSHVAHELPSARLLLAGKPNTPTEPYLNLIAERELAGVVSTRFEFVPTQEASLYFGAADVVVLPYLEASQSGALLTAYRFGRPVIVTETGGLPETVEHGENGLVVPPGDEVSLAVAIIQLLSDPTSARRMGDRSKQLGLERHNWKAIARRTMAVYRELEGE